MIAKREGRCFPKIAFLPIFYESLGRKRKCYWRLWRLIQDEETDKINAAFRLLMFVCNSLDRKVVCLQAHNVLWRHISFPTCIHTCKERAAVSWSLLCNNRDIIICCVRRLLERPENVYHFCISNRFAFCYLIRCILVFQSNAKEIKQENSIDRQNQWQNHGMLE